ncbi:MAG TPA: tetratricopeptide repeat protein [Steroidobacteraceae bacterium]|nr:tetratricopeptide repeat protein [Steroidobacteraceae bacterium]
MNDQPTSAAAYAEQAFWYIERRRIAEAKRLLAQALAQYPQDPDLLFHSAQAEWFDDENETAEKTVRQVLVVDPHHAPARQLLAAMLVQRGEYADAELLLIGLLREYPESAELYGRYSQLMLRTLHLDKAGQLAREGLRYDPEDDECLLAAALCETARSGSRPNAGLQKLLTAHPESMSSVHALVVALVESGRIAEAHRIAQGAMRADPANEHLVDLVRELRIQNHWSMKPLWPLQKWGWGASVVMWLGGIVVIRALAKSAPDIAGPVAWVWLGYALYSWVWPPLIRRIL